MDIDLKIIFNNIYYVNVFQSPDLGKIKEIEDANTKEIEVILLGNYFNNETISMIISLAKLLID